MPEGKVTDPRSTGDDPAGPDPTNTTSPVPDYLEIQGLKSSTSQPLIYWPGVAFKFNSVVPFEVENLELEDIDRTLKKSQTILIPVAVNDSGNDPIS